jgi:hypothetical protein
MTQTPRQMRERREAAAKLALHKAGQTPAPARTGLSRSALFAGLIVVFATGVFAAPFAQYYLGPRLAELSGITDLAAGRPEPADFSRLRDIEQRTEQLGSVIDSIVRDAKSDSEPRVATLENELSLLREEFSGLSALTERTASLENNTTNLAALEARLADIEAQPSPGTDATVVQGRLTSLDEILVAVREESVQLAATVDVLQAKLAEDLKATLALVEDRLTALERTWPGDSGLVGVVKSLELRTSALESALDQSVGRSALVASLSTLRVSAQSGRPFNVELQTVRALSLTLQASQLIDPLDRLAVLAEDGLPTLVVLQRSFTSLAGRAAQGAPSGGGTWVGQTLNRVTSLVTVRRTGEIAGQSAEAVVARTERFLEEGDLARAVDEASLLVGQSVEIDGWLSRAQRRLDAELALDDLSTQALAIGGAG